MCTVAGVGEDPMGCQTHPWVFVLQLQLILCPTDLEARSLDDLGPGLWVAEARALVAARGSDMPCSTKDTEMTATVMDGRHAVTEVRADTDAEDIVFIATRGLRPSAREWLGHSDGGALAMR